MIILLLLALTLGNSNSSLLLEKTSDIAAIFHRNCVQILPTESVNPKTLSSLLCGENITENSLKQNLIKTSLIHIFVISGSHLILLDELLSILKIPLFVRFIFLTGYSLATGWQAPAVRALIALATRTFFKFYKWPFSSDLTILCAGMITLCLYPAWWNSLSLLMSWCAALALCWTSVLRIRENFWRTFLSQLAIFLFMSLPLLGIGNLHPLSVIFNLLLAPVVSFVLLPLAFLSVLIHPLLKVFDFVMALFSTTLNVFSDPITVTAGERTSIGFLWLWIFAWHVIFHFLRLKIYQGRDHARE